MKIKLMRGDCLERMKEIPDASIDLVVTSPPYDKLRDYNGNVSQWSFDKFRLIMEQLFRVLKQGGVIVWIVNDQTINGSETGTSFRQALYAIEIGFNLHDTMIWKKDSFAFPNSNRYYPIFEYMFVFSKGRPKSVNMLSDRKNKYGGTKIHGTLRQIDGALKPHNGIGKRKVAEYGRRFNIWDISVEKNNKTGHPAVFPISLARDHIISWSKERDTILDPFMGSGTTGVACVNTGRNFIGIELDKGYYKVARDRIKEAKQNSKSKD